MDDVIWRLHEVKVTRYNSLGYALNQCLRSYSKDPMITDHIKSNSKLRLELNADTEFYIQSDIN